MRASKTVAGSPKKRGQKMNNILDFTEPEREALKIIRKCLVCAGNAVNERRELSSRRTIELLAFQLGSLAAYNALFNQIDPATMPAILAQMMRGCDEGSKLFMAEWQAAGVKPS
jgi:hypothetical protein